MTQCTLSLLSMALMLPCWTAAAVADPITAVYHVQVTQRMTADSNPNWLAFEQEFTLRLTFDPLLGSGRSYGPATFSPLPLVGVDPPAGLPLTTFGSTAHGRFDENPFGPRNLFASATVSEYHVGAEWNYFRSTRLITNIPTGDPPPAFTAETFPQHLVLGSPFNFDYGTSLFEMTPSIRLVGSLQYRGLASLIEVSPAAPVPEPATVALVGGALVLLARNRRRIGRESV